MLEHAGIPKTNSYSIFAQGDWSFADKWKLILGGRYTQEKNVLW
ncbi:MAG: TonB-dependent receptor [Sphingomonadales bacterium]|nr:TonB-dependent receptor [Sphingomonadales bacterium]